MCVCVCVCVYVRARASKRVRVSASARMRVCFSVFCRCSLFVLADIYVDFLFVFVTNAAT